MKWTICLGLILILVLMLNTKEGFVNTMNLSYNEMSPYCEDIMYTSDSGFICLSDQQKNQLYTRGGNRSMMDADVFNF
jgi:hypothetical protein